MPCAKLTPEIRNVDGGDVGVYRCDEVRHSFLFLIWLCRENSNFPAALRQTEFQLAAASISTRDAMQENFYDPALSGRICRRSPCKWCLGKHSLQGFMYLDTILLLH